MSTPIFPWMLQLIRFLTAFFFGVGCLSIFHLLGLMSDAATYPEVRLTVSTDRPALFNFWHGVEAGYEDGIKHESRNDRLWAALPPMQPNQTFELMATPNTRLLHYREPSALKRVALLALGALPGYASVPGLLFWIYGSWLLLKLLQDVTPESPFTQANARRLARLTLLIMGLNFWEYFAQASILALVPAFRTVGVTGALNQYVQLNTSDLVPGFEVGFILFVIAAVYRRGVELSQEAELII